MNKRIFFPIAALCLGTFFVADHLLMPNEPSVVTNNPFQAKSHSTEMNSDVSSESVLGYQSVHGNLPASLRGTQMDQALYQDDNGALIITPDLKRVFNYFLSANQEESIEMIVKRISEYLDVYLDGQALAEALAIMESYIQMKQAFQTFEKTHGEQQAELLANGNSGYGSEHLSYLESMLQQRKDLRDQFLSPHVAATLYEREDAYDQFMIEKLKIQANDQLSAAEKQEALHALRIQQDPDWMAARSEASLPDTLREETQKLVEQGASQEDIQALRVSMVGTEAAHRYSQLDQERAQWQQRLDNYLADRQKILEQSGISAEDQQEQIGQLRSSRFDPREQIRVRVYERQASR